MHACGRYEAQLLGSHGPPGGIGRPAIFIETPVVIEIPAQLLVAPIQHLVNGLDLRMQQGTESTRYTRPLLSTGKSASRLSHLMHH